MSSDPNDISDEAPPAYTPIADPHQGETPLVFGPRRPFQDPQPDIVPSIPAINVNDTGTSAADRSSHSSRFDFEPPPRHPSVVAPSPTPTNPSHESLVVPSAYPRLSGDIAHLPSSPAEVRSYSPPPGPPPRRAVSVSSRPSGPTTESNSIPDDGRPTTTPTPGHPLLRGGKLLVYPNGFECSKCHNIGFKNNDPSHPCNKCWDKYARSYSGALAYAPFPSAGSSHSAGNFQRPLPVFRPPQAPRPHSMPGYPGKLHRAQSRPPPPPQSQSYQPHMPPQTPQLPSPPSQEPPHPPQGYPSPQYGYPYPHHQGLSFSPPPVPPHLPMQPQAPTILFPVPQPAHPIALLPGDPRIGGRLCWRCDGRGRVSFLIFDSTLCEVCRGVGRVFN